VSGRWKEVVRLGFDGPRFRDHALDLTALTELSQFQRMVAETAKTLWCAANPERERLPRRFEERTRLCLRRIDEGSATVPLEVFLEEPEQKGLFEREPVEVKEAIGLVHKVYRAIERNEPLPDGFPRALLSHYEVWGQGLGDDEAIRIVPPGMEPVRVTSASRSRLATFGESPHEGHVDVTGEVLEADVRLRHFQVWLDDVTHVTVAFSPEQEDEVTSALRGHHTLRLQVIGRGEFSPLGKPLRVTEVEELRLQPVGEVPYDPVARRIEDVLVELAAEVPQEEWDRLPADLTDNLDHYIYGTPKR